MRVFSCLAGLCLVLILGACEAFAPDSLALANQVRVYVSQGGHQRETYRFDATGRAGDYSLEIESFVYATQAAASAGIDTSRSWRQTGGQRGSFSYDPESHQCTRTLGEAWGPLAGSGPIVVGGVTTAYESYDWQPWTAYWSALGTSYQSYARVESGSLVLSADNAETQALVLQAGGEWGRSWTTTIDYAQAGVAWRVETRETESCRIGEWLVERSAETLVTTSRAGQEQSRETDRSDESFAVAEWHLIGETGPDESFGAAWTAGKRVAFLLERNRLDSYGYTGSTPPAEPTAFGPNGQAGVPGPAKPYRLVDRSPTPASWSYEHHGDFLLPLAETAGRNGAGIPAAAGD